MRDLKKIKQIHHRVFLEQTETIFGETKLFSNGNNAPDAME